ncbi:MAG: Uncharacterized protein JWN38_919 [Candidatus Saccharibacteria bacterium]|nr:Uncharacterized protein [Candidatus Saccharibacteria bacterium]
MPASAVMAEFDHQNRALQVLRFAGQAALTGVALALPLIAGTLHGASKPVTTELAPGVVIESDARLGSDSPERASQLDFGPLVGSLSVPNARYSLPFGRAVTADVALRKARINVSNLEPITGVGEAVASNPQGAIIKPVLKKVEHNLLEGLGEGAAVDAAFVIGFGTQRRRKSQAKKLELALKNHEEHLLSEGRDPASEPSFREVARSGRAPYRHSRQRRLAAFGLALATVGTSVAYSYDKLNKGGPVEMGTPLDSSVVALGPDILKGATVHDGLSIGNQQAINEGLQQILSKKDVVDSSMEAIAQNINVAFDQQEATNPLHYKSDEEFEDVLVVSDFHCNLPLIQKVLPTVIHRFGAQTVVNLGDNDVSTGILPFESLCVSDFVESLKPTTLYPTGAKAVFIAGNHDSTKITSKQMRTATVKGLDGKKYNPVTVLDKDNDYHTTVNGLTFVGGPDQRQSIFGTTIQPGPGPKADQILAQLGSTLADTACKIKKESGKAPTVLSHEAQGSYESIVRDCAELVETGHVHQQTLPETLGQVNSFVQGTSSGVSEGQLSVYAKLGREADFTDFVYSKRTGHIIGYRNLVVQPDGSTTLSDLQPMPSTAQDYPDELVSFMIANRPKAFLAVSDQSEPTLIPGEALPAIPAKAN